MVKKLQVIVREIYESEETETIIANKVTGEIISSWDFKQLPEDERAKWTHNEVSTGKSKIEVGEGDPIYGQVFTDDKLDIKDLILHLNRTR